MRPVAGVRLQANARTGIVLNNRFRPALKPCTAKDTVQSGAPTAPDCTGRTGRGRESYEKTALRASLSRFPGKTGSPTGSRFCGGMRLQATRGGRAAAGNARTGIVLNNRFRPALVYFTAKDTVKFGA